MKKQKVERRFFLFHRLCFVPLFRRARKPRSRGPSETASRVPTRELSQMASIWEKQSRRRRAGGAESPSRRRGATTGAIAARRRCRSQASLFSRGLFLPFLPLSRDSDRPRQRAVSSRSREETTREKKGASERAQSSKKKVFDPRSLLPPAAQSKRAKNEGEKRAELALYFPYVPAASLAALGPVDRVPGVLHHGERTTKKKERKERRVEKTRSCEKRRERERAAAASFFLRRRAGREHRRLAQKKTRQQRPTTLSFSLSLSLSI